MSPFEIENLNSLKNYEGREFPPTDWLVISQERINKFAEATEDFQWIHIDVERAKREMPSGSTIAHGYLTLSLVSYLSAQAFVIREGVGRRINYGLNRVRFVSPVRAGTAIRARVTLLSVKESPEYVDIMFSTTVENQGAEKPCCVVENLARYYRA